MKNIKSIDANTAHEWLENNDAIVIDVREPHEYETSHIPGSYLIPLAALSKTALPKNAHGKKIILHCKFGKRGLKACEKLLSEDVKLEIYNLEGGMSAWEEVGFVIEK